MKTFYRIVFLLIFLISTNLFAQMEKAQTVLKNSSYIVNGKVLDFSFPKDKSGQQLIAYKILVKQSLKGNAFLLDGDTIEVCMPLPERMQIFDDGYGVSHEQKMPSPFMKGWVLDKNTQGVFGLKKSAIQSTNESGLKVFEPSVSPIENTFFLVVPFLVRYDKIEEVNVCTYTIEGFGLHFASFSDFNKFLKKSNVLPIQDVHPYEKKSAATLKRDSLNAIQYAKRVANAKRRDSILKTRMQKKTTNPSKAYETINFEIANKQVTGSGTQYFEFDILTYGNTSNTYFENAAFVLEFNTFVFGIDLSANNLITITAGNDFNTPTYIDPMLSVTDENSYSVRFGIGVDFNGTSWNRTLLTPTPTVLLHVKMQLSICQGNPELDFADITNVSSVDWYQTNATADPLTTLPLTYDNPYYIPPGTYTLCPPPAIIDFNPKTISAGTKSILTIIGNGFGNTRGASQVRFMDANTANTTIQFLDSYDYISWSDTEIKIKLPYFVDSLSQNFFPGSGYFSIKKGNGDTLVSPQPLTVKYSVMNYDKVDFGLPGYEKLPYRHVDFTYAQNGHAREFVLDTSITNNPQMAAIVFKALKTWSCVTGINWVVTDTVTERGIIVDNKSIIFLTDIDFFASTSAILGKTKSNAYRICTDFNTNEEYAAAKETDIAFPRYWNTDTLMMWLYDTTMNQDVPLDTFDFYQTVMHELGHAHYLGHIRKIDDVMYYGLIDGPTPASSRVHLYTSPYSMEGGTYVMNKDLALGTTGVCSGDPTGTVEPQYVSYCGDLGIFPYQKKEEDADIKVYPNPFEQSFTINFSLLHQTQVSYRVADVSGRIIYQKTQMIVHEGNFNEKIQLNNCAQGFYILSVQLGNKTNSFRLIKH